MFGESIEMSSRLPREFKFLEPIGIEKSPNSRCDNDVTGRILMSTDVWAVLVGYVTINLDARTPGVRLAQNICKTVSDGPICR